MASTAVRYLLLGGGLASASAAEAIRKRDPEGSILIVGDEASLPYNRPPISKQFLLDKMPAEKTLVKRPDWYGKQKVDVRTGTRATALDLERRSVFLDDGDQVEYEKLLLATGARLKRLPLPGDDLPNVHYLRTIEHSKAIKEAAVAGRKAIVLGGGFIGLELASAFSQRGLAVTLLEYTDQIWRTLLDGRVAHWLAEYFRSKGVDIQTDSHVVELLPNGVRLKGGQVLKSDLIAVGVGVEPDMTLYRGTPLEGPRGISTNSRLETAVPGVYAAGDVAWYDDIVYGKKRRVEHWETAKQHGAVAGAGMAGDVQQYDGLPFFFSDLFDLAFEFVGDFEEGWDGIDLDGSMDDKKFGAVYKRAGRPVAAMHVNEGGGPFTELETMLREAVAAGRSS